VLPQLSSYQVVSFSATTTVSGLEITTLSSAAGKLGFLTAIAKSMTGVRYIDVNIVSMAQGSRRELKTVDNRVNMNSIDSFSEREEEKMEMFGHDLIMPRRLATACTVTWNVSVALTRLGTTSGSTAYSSMTSQLSTAMNSGTFVTTIKSQSTIFSNVSSASVAANAYTVVTAITPTAAPTSTPTVTAIVPSVSQMSISTFTRTSLTLSVTLIKTRVVEGDISSGYLYCVAMANGSAPSSIGSIKALSLDSAVLSKKAVKDFPVGSTFPLTSSITFTGLISLQAYAVYCYVETSLGTGNPLSEVLKTKIVQTTACCKVLIFINSPVFIFGDVSKYTASSLKSTYIFTYSLSSAPLKSLQVTPVFSLNGVVSTAIVATPSSFDFTSKSQLTGQFFLSASSEISGSYTLSLTASGSSKAQYAIGVSTVVQILSTSSPVPAPLIISSRFSDSGQAVVITFDSLTDQAGIITASWPCSLLFTFSSASMTTCSWVNTSAVSASFGVLTNVASKIAYLSIGDSVKLNGGLLKSFCLGTVDVCSSNPVASDMSVITLAPLQASTPTVIVNAPQFLGSCNNLSLDATGSYGNGGRPYTAVVWTVSATDTTVDVSAIQSYLNSASALYQVGKLFSISATILTKATYTFTLSLKNFMGLSNFITIVTVVTSDPNLPILVIIGPTYQTIVASSSLTILSAATLSSCASKATAVRYSWLVQKDGLGLSIASTSLDPTKFSLAPYALAVDTTYTVTITASVGTTSSSSVSVTVFVSKGDVTAAVVGGYIRTASVDKVFSLDASISNDAAVSPAVAPTLAYKWTCSVGSLTNFGTECGLFGGAAIITTRKFTLTANIMALSTTYMFLVVVSAPDGRSASRIVSVTTISSGPEMEITSSFITFNVGSKLVINGYIKAPYTVTSEWSVYSSSGVAIPFIALTPVTKTFSAMDAASLITYPLSVDGSTFNGGSFYSFRLTVYPVSNPAIRTISEIILHANSHPTGGYVSRSPKIGDALVTLFEISTIGWTADAANFPLKFSFYYQLSATSPSLTIAASSLRAFTTTTLPAGLVTESYSVTLRAIATDLYLSSATAYSTVEVTMSKNTNVTQVLESNLGSAFDTGDVNLVFQTVNNVSRHSNYHIYRYNFPFSFLHIISRIPNFNIFRWLRQLTS
jgi:hypothetical protein